MSTVISKSVRRAFSLLELFSRERRPLTATQIEAALRLPQASALVLAKELADIGYLTVETESRTYFPSERLLELTAWLAQADLPVRRLRELADEVSRATQETVSICSRNGRRLQIEHFALGTLSGSIVMPKGRAGPLPCSGAGRAVLATLPEESVADVIHDVARRDPQYRFDAEEALRDVRTARRKGYLTTYDLMIPGVGAVAFPLPAIAGGNFALVIAAPTPRIRTTEAELLRACMPILQRRFGKPPARRRPKS